MGDAERDQPSSPRQSLPKPTRPPTPLTDSPWFWLCLFGCAALIGLVVVAPKYARRGQRLEWQRQGREHAFRERAAGTTSTDVDGETNRSQPLETGLAPPSPPGVWPLIAVIGGVLFLGGAAVFTLRLWRADRSPPADAPPRTGG